MPALNFGTDYVPTGMYDLNAFPTNSFVVKYKDPTTGNLGKAAVTATVSGGTTTYSINIGSTNYTLNGYDTKLGNYYTANGNAVWYDNRNLYYYRYGYFVNATASYNGGSYGGYNPLLNVINQPTQVTDGTQSYTATSALPSLSSITGTIQLLSYDPQGNLSIQINPSATVSCVMDTPSIWSAAPNSGTTPIPWSNNTSFQNLLFNGERIYLPSNSGQMPGIAVSNTTTVLNAMSTTDGRCFYATPNNPVNIINTIANLNSGTMGFPTISAYLGPYHKAMSANVYADKTYLLPSANLFMNSAYGLVGKQVVAQFFMGSPASLYIVLEDSHTGQFMSNALQDTLGRAMRVQIVQAYNSALFGQMYLPIDLTVLGSSNLNFIQNLGFTPIVPGSNVLYPGADYFPTSMYNNTINKIPNNSFVIKYKNPTTGGYTKTNVLSNNQNGTITYGIILNNQYYTLFGYKTYCSNYYELTGLYGINSSNASQITSKIQPDYYSLMSTYNWDVTVYGSMFNTFFMISPNGGATTIPFTFTPNITCTTLNQGSSSITFPNGRTYNLSSGLPGTKVSGSPIGPYFFIRYNPAASSNNLYSLKPNLSSLFANFAFMFNAFTVWSSGYQVNSGQKISQLGRDLSGALVAGLAGSLNGPLRGVGYCTFKPHTSMLFDNESLEIQEPTADFTWNSALTASSNGVTWNYPVINIGTGSYSSPSGAPTTMYHAMTSVYGMSVRKVLATLQVLTNVVGTLTPTLNCYVIYAPGSGQFLASGKVDDNGNPLRVEIVTAILTSGQSADFNSLYFPVDTSKLNLATLASQGFTVLQPQDAADVLVIMNATTSINNATATINNTITSMQASLAAAEASLTAVNNVASLVTALNDAGVNAVVANTQTQVTTIRGYITQTQTALTALGTQFTAAQNTSPQVLSTFQGLQTSYQNLASTATANNSLATQAASTASSNANVITTTVQVASANVGQLKSIADAAVLVAQTTAAANQVGISALQVQSNVYRVQYIEEQFNDLPNYDQAIDTQLKQLITDTQALLPQVNTQQTAATTASELAKAAVTAAQNTATTDPTFTTKAANALTTAQAQLTAATNASAQASTIANQANQKVTAALDLVAQYKQSLIAPKLADIDKAITTIEQNIAQLQQALQDAQKSADQANASLTSVQGMTDQASIKSVQEAAKKANENVTSIQQVLSQAQTQLSSLQTTYNNAKTDIDVVSINSLAQSIPDLAKSTTNNVSNAQQQVTDSTQQAQTAQSSAQVAQQTESSSFPSLIQQGTAKDSETSGFLTQANAAITQIEGAIQQAQTATQAASLFSKDAPDLVGKLTQIAQEITALLTQTQGLQASISAASSNSGNAVKSFPTVPQGSSVTTEQSKALQTALATINQANQDAKDKSKEIADILKSATDKGNDAQALLINQPYILITQYTKTIDGVIPSINDNLTKMQALLTPAQDIATAIQNALTRTDLTNEQKSQLQTASTTVNQNITVMSSTIANIQSIFSTLQTQYTSAKNATNIGVLKSICTNIGTLKTNADNALTTVQTASDTVLAQKGVIPQSSSTGNTGILSKILDFFAYALSLISSAPSRVLKLLGRG
jgi:hypothetical protein